MPFDEEETKRKPTLGPRPHKHNTQIRTKTTSSVEDESRENTSHLFVCENEGNKNL